MKHYNFIALIALSWGAWAQASIKIEKMYYDFGELKEGDPAVVEFQVINSGKSPLIISNAQPSCGCTIGDWTKTPIAPGEKGVVKASYGTQGRPGFFNKSVTVYSNDPEKPTQTLYIRGVVTPKQEINYTAEQLRTSPKAVLEKNIHNFGRVEKNTKIPYKIALKNLGRSDLKIADVTAVCNCVSVQNKSDYIKSGDTGYIEIIYVPNELGIASDVVNIKTNDLTNGTIKFTLEGNVVENINAPTVIKETKGFVPFK